MARHGKIAKVTCVDRVNVAKLAQKSPKIDLAGWKCYLLELHYSPVLNFTRKENELTLEHLDLHGSFNLGRTDNNFNPHAKRIIGPLTYLSSTSISWWYLQSKPDFVSKVLRFKNIEKSAEVFIFYAIENISWLINKTTGIHIVENVIYLRQLQKWVFCYFEIP